MLTCLSVDVVLENVGLSNFNKTMLTVFLITTYAKHYNLGSADHQATQALNELLLSAESLEQRLEPLYVIRPQSEKVPDHYEDDDRRSYA